MPQFNTHESLTKPIDYQAADPAPEPIMTRTFQQTDCPKCGARFSPAPPAEGAKPEEYICPTTMCVGADENDSLGCKVHADGAEGAKCPTCGSHNKAERGYKAVPMWRKGQITTQLEDVYCPDHWHGTVQDYYLDYQKAVDDLVDAKRERDEAQAALRSGPGQRDWEADYYSEKSKRETAERERYEAMSDAKRWKTASDANRDAAMWYQDRALTAERRAETAERLLKGGKEA